MRSRIMTIGLFLLSACASTGEVGHEQGTLKVRTEKPPIENTVNMSDSVFKSITFMSEYGLGYEGLVIGSSEMLIKGLVGIINHEKSEPGPRVYSWTNKERKIRVPDTLKMDMNIRPIGGYIESGL